MTPNSRRVMFEQKNNIAYSDTGAKSNEQLVSENKDTRGSKKRRQIVAQRKMGHDNNLISPNRNRLQAGSTPAGNVRSGGFLSRGLKFLQAGLSPRHGPAQNSRQNKVQQNFIVKTSEVTSKNSDILANLSKNTTASSSNIDENITKSVNSNNSTTFDSQDTENFVETVENIKNSEIQPKTSTQIIPESFQNTSNHSDSTNLTKITQLSNSQVRERSDSPLNNLPPIKTRKIDVQYENKSTQVDIEGKNSYGFPVPILCTQQNENFEIQSAALFWIARMLIQGVEAEKIKEKAVSMFSKKDIFEAYKIVMLKCNMTIDERRDGDKAVLSLCKEILTIINIPEYNLRKWKFSIPVELDEPLPFQYF